MYSKQTDDLMKLLKSFPDLLTLSVSSDAEEDRLESLHFQDGWFKNLKLLQIRNFHSLSSIYIDKGALGSLKVLLIDSIPQLKILPTGIQHLKKLDFLHISSASNEFMQSIAPNERKEHWIFKQVPSVEITTS
jgi:disease resistance protein RPM1